MVLPSSTARGQSPLMPMLRTPHWEPRDSALWEVHVDEGLSWIRHDQHLDLVPSHFD